jgi:hypothetical protein
LNRTCMKQPFSFACIFFLVLFLSGCKKDNENIPVKSYKTIVELTPDYRIFKVTNFKNDHLNYIKSFECDELFTHAYHVPTEDPSHERWITKYEYIFR